jgi:sn-glycerol 3-phosphate transport system ATP-binding protein
LYQQPATAFAARFIGTPAMNVITLADGPGGAIISGCDGFALFDGPGERLTLGLRPEHIRLSSEGRFPAEIRSVDYHGADSIIECAIGSQIVLVRAEGVSGLLPGQRVRLAWEPDAMHVFNAETGQRVDHLPATDRSSDRVLRAVQ